MSGRLWGEIDTRPIESVRTALTMFEDKVDQIQKKHQAKRSLSECEKELDEMSKKFADCKAQLEAKNAAYIQALFKVEHHQKMNYELSTLLKKSDMERNKWTSAYAEARARIDGHQSKLKEMADQLLENHKVREQLLRILSELKATQRDLLNKETLLDAARDSELKPVSQTEKRETALNTGKEKREIVCLSELSEAIHMSEKDKHAMLSEKDEKIELATTANSQSKKRLEHMRKQVEIVQGSENQFVAKSIMQEFMDMELRERKMMDQTLYIETLEIELNRLKKEFTDSKKEVNVLNINIESLTDELHNAKEEINMVKEREVEAQAETTLLKSQLHKDRSLFACSEAEKVEKQNHRIKQKEYGVADESENPSRVLEVSQTNHLKPESEDRNFDSDSDHITIPLKAVKATEVPASVVEIGSQSELAHLKKELEASAHKIGELRARAEQALSRAELAEKAKAALEGKLKRKHEERQRRRAALTVLKEEFTPKPYSPSSSDARPTLDQPLGKVLNIKF